MLNVMRDSLRDLAANLRRMRVALKMSQQTLADRANTTQGFISGLEQCTIPNPTHEKLEELARVLGCSMSDLYSGSGQTEQEPGKPAGLSTLIVNQDTMLSPTEPRISALEVEMLQACPHRGLTATGYLKILRAVREAIRYEKIENKIQIHLDPNENPN
jgi:transcriptional regulator with XRE-family HTH domain